MRQWYMPVQHGPSSRVSYCCVGRIPRETVAFSSASVSKTLGRPDELGYMGCFGSRRPPLELLELVVTHRRESPRAIITPMFGCGTGVKTVSRQALESLVNFDLQNRRQPTSAARDRAVGATRRCGSRGQMSSRPGRRDVMMKWAEILDGQLEA